MTIFIAVLTGTLGGVAIGVLGTVLVSLALGVKPRQIFKEASVQADDSAEEASPRKQAQDALNRAMNRRQGP